MGGRVLLLASLFATTLASARDKPETWIEVRSQHFVVATNSNEKQGRRIADQFERMRSVFHTAFPKLQMDPDAPIVVLAIKDEKDFRALEPESYLAKGSLKLGGLFLRAPDKNYVLMRLDAEGDHPYSVVYHEYTHLLLSKPAEWMPLWLNEGLAEFYQTTDIHEKEASLGKPSGESVIWLRQNKLLPLATLFAVDDKSSYYHEENKGSIFYAESWALTHMITMSDIQDRTHRLTDYAELLQRKTDPVTAAARAFGDLKVLQSALEHYVGQAAFHFVTLATTTEVEDSAFQVHALTLTQADALRADFLAYNQRTTDARAILDRVLKEDPNSVSAHETMGYLEFRQGHIEEARKWYAQAVQLDSQSYLAHYYFAAMSINGGSAGFDEAQVEKSLRTAIKLNPSFAPAYDSLAILLTTHHGNLDEAHRMGVTAVSLDPGNVGYRINVAHVLLTMGQGQNAIMVLHAAAKLAKTPQEEQTVNNFLMNAEEYVAARERFDARTQVGQAAVDHAESTSPGSASGNAADPPVAQSDKFVSSGPHHFLVGKLKNVHCDRLQIDLTVDAGAKSRALHAENFYKIQFTTLNFAPSEDLNPCQDLEGRPAKVEYVESADKSATARVLSVELHQ
jgi:Tfp pilus assembly protein PilF